MADAFDAFAAAYDAGFTDSEPARILRESVWARLAPLLRPGMRVLDLGCGTGEDAVWLARAGCEVTAVDGSPAMLDMAWRKAMHRGVGAEVECRLFDLNNPGDVGGPFDLVLSNFGALNCALDLAKLADSLRSMLSPGGALALTVMGRFCLWESLQFSRSAWRRWKGHATAKIGASDLPIRYWTPGDIGRAFGPGFRQEVYPVGSFLPPSEFFPRLIRHPNGLALLAHWERRAASLAPLAWLADHHLSILRQKDRT